MVIWIALRFGLLLLALLVVCVEVYLATYHILCEYDAKTVTLDPGSVRSGLCGINAEFRKLVLCNVQLSFWWAYLRKAER